LCTLAAIATWDAEPVADALLRAIGGAASGTAWTRAGPGFAVAVAGGPPAEPGALADGTSVVAADACLDNRPGLLATLAPELSRLPNRSDAALILAAWRRWGGDCPAQLIGDFAFVVWDGGAQRLFAARDAMNMRDLHFATARGRLCVASTVEQALRLPGVRPVIRAQALAGWVAGAPDPDLSLFRDVERLPAGHCLTADRRGVRVTRYWEIAPDARVRYRRVADYEEHLRALLGRCVADRLRTEAATVATQLSGGMDSTSVTALARRAAEAAGKSLFAISHAYDAAAGCDESDLIGATVSHLGLSRHRFLAAEGEHPLPFPALYPPALDSPGTVESPRYGEELALVRGAGADVLLTGSGGDEMTWGHSLTHSRRLLRGDLAVIGEVVAGTRELGLPLLRTLVQVFVRPLLPAPAQALARRALGRPQPSPLPPWLPPATARRLDVEERFLAGTGRRFRNPALQARYDALVRTATLNSVRSYRLVGRAAGVDVRHPFFDRRLAEFSFAIPDDLWLRDSYPKWLLRRAMTGLLPDAVVWKRQKVVFDTFFGRLLKAQAPLIRRILSDPRLESAGLIENAAILAAFDAAVASEPPRLNVDLLYALLAQVWVQRHAGVVEL
jgi:asparagine synthase (glutamine-hydrolysing)